MNRFVLLNSVVISPLNLFVARRIKESDTQALEKAKDSTKSETPKPDNDAPILQEEIERRAETDDTAKLKDIDSKTVTETVSPSVPVEVESMTILESMLAGEDFEAGISNNSEKYFSELIISDRLSALNGISSLFLKNYSPQNTKANILVGLLHIVSHFDYNSIYPAGQMMALCALSHVNKEVAEYGIKCYENWGNKDGIEKLRAVNFSASWLKEYAEEVIEELNEGD